MEPNYIKTSVSAIKSQLMAKALEESPIDKKKAIHGEKNQASYLLKAKEQNSPLSKKHSFFDQTFDGPGSTEYPLKSQ